MSGCSLGEQPLQLWHGEPSACTSRDVTCTVCHMDVYAPLSCEHERPVIHIYDGRGENKEIAILDKLHSAPITFMEVCVTLAHTVVCNIGLYCVYHSLYTVHGLRKVHNMYVR